MNLVIDVTNYLIKTKRLILRPFKNSDLDDLFEYAKVEGVGEMAGWKHHSSIEDSKAILDMFLNEKNVLAISYNDKVIGSIGIEKYPESLFPELHKYNIREIGFVLSKDYWNQGLMTEAVNGLIDYLFQNTLIDGLICAHYNFNKQSKKVQEKVGFIRYKHDLKHFSQIYNSEVIGWYSLLFKDKNLNKKFNLKSDGKYQPLWDYIFDNDLDEYKLSFDLIKNILGFNLDKSILNYKDELTKYGYEISDLDLQNKYICFIKVLK